jgi:hypothetical protein
MSEQEMNRLADAMLDGYNALIRYVEITGKGDVDKLQSTIAYAFGLSWRTAKERIEFLKSAGFIVINGKTWKWMGNNQQNAMLLKCIADPTYGLETKPEEETRKADTDALINHIKSKAAHSQATTADVR